MPGPFPMNTTSDVKVVARLKFECPKCGHNAIREWNYGSVTSTEVAAVIEDGIVGYGEEWTKQEERTRYKCAQCQFLIPRCKDDEDLAKYLKNQMAGRCSVGPQTPLSFCTDNE